MSFKLAAYVFAIPFSSANFIRQRNENGIYIMNVFLSLCPSHLFELFAQTPCFVFIPVELHSPT